MEFDKNAQVEIYTFDGDPRSSLWRYIEHKQVDIR